jgi:hypothetical protein
MQRGLPDRETAANPWSPRHKIILENPFVYHPEKVAPDTMDRLPSFAVPPGQVEAEHCAR